MAHKHSIYDTDPHFKIDPATRAIQNESGKVKLMQYDHKSERFTFEIPRFIDGHDMSLCNLVTIDFDNVESSTKAKNSDVYEVDDLQLSPASESVVIFSWLIEDSATQFKGDLKFSISFQCIAANGEVEYDFGTDIHYGITIGERLRNAASVVEKGSNILAQWKADLFGIGDTEEANLRAVSQEQQSDISEAGQTQVDAVNARGAAVLETIPEDYQALSALADKNARIKAGAIVLKAEGESIAVADSANAYLAGMKLYGKSEQIVTTGKNLCSLNNLTFTQMENVTLDKPIPAGTYFLSLIATSKDTDDTTCVINFYSNETAVHGARFARGESIKQQVTFKQDITNLYCYASMSFLLGENDEATFSNIMIAVDENAEYEPYSGGKPSPSPEYPQEIKNVEEPTTSILGKNLTYTRGSKDITYEGLHIVITKGLSEILLNGTTTRSFGYAMSEGTYLPRGIYTMSVHGLNKLSSKYDQAYLMNTVTRDTICSEVKDNQPKTFVVTDPGNHRVDFLFAEGSSYDNVSVKIQIEAGDAATDYAPYTPAETLSISRTLPGIPVSSGGNYTDSNGQQWICDEVDFERGVYIQRVKSVVCDGSSDEYWCTINATGGVIFGHALQDAAAEGSSKKLRSSHFAVSVTGAYNKEFDSCYFYDKTLRICHMGIEALDDFKAWLADNPITILYILATPIETPLSDAELLAFKALRSNKPATTILNDSGMFMSVDYVADTKTYIDNKIAEIIKNS